MYTVIGALVISALYQDTVNSTRFSSLASFQFKCYSDYYRASVVEAAPFAKTATEAMKFSDKLLIRSKLTGKKAVPTVLALADIVATLNAHKYIILVSRIKNNDNIPVSAVVVDEYTKESIISLVQDVAAADSTRRRRDAGKGKFYSWENSALPHILRKLPNWEIPSTKIVSTLRDLIGDWDWFDSYKVFWHNDARKYAGLASRHDLDALDSSVVFAMSAFVADSEFKGRKSTSAHTLLHEAAHSIQHFIGVDKKQRSGHSETFVSSFLYLLTKWGVTEQEMALVKKSLRDDKIAYSEALIRWLHD